MKISRNYKITLEVEALKREPILSAMEKFHKINNSSVTLKNALNPVDVADMITSLKDDIFACSLDLETILNDTILADVSDIWNVSFCGKGINLINVVEENVEKMSIADRVVFDNFNTFNRDFLEELINEYITNFKVRMDRSNVRNAIPLTRITKEEA